MFFPAALDQDLSPITIVELNSTSLTFTWSRSQENVTSIHLNPFNYTVCVNEPITDSTVMANGSFINSTIFNGTFALGYGNITVESTMSNNTILNSSIAYGVENSSCESVGYATRYTVIGLKSLTEYVVIVRAQSLSGFDSEMIEYVTTLQNGKLVFWTVSLAK